MKGAVGLKRNYEKDYQDRPARKQVEYAQSQSIENTGTYNIWYSRFSGDGNRFGKGLEKAAHRCILERDAGKTKAGKKGLFCLHFARGCCSKGNDCTFLHRIPMPGDRTETTLDCFGRDKHRLDRDDMGGIGSFDRLNSTLYVGHVSIDDDMQGSVSRHFSEWGDVEHINILQDKGVAFVRYVDIPNAEFAKEAMNAQSLDSGEVLNVRWATDDPNPGVIARNKRKAEAMVEKAIKARLPTIGPNGTIADYERSFNNQRLDTSAPTAGQVAAYQNAQAMQIQGVPQFTTDMQANQATIYYAYYAQYGYFPSADGKSFVYDPSRIGSTAIPAAPVLEQSGSSAYAIPLKKKVATEGLVDSLEQVKNGSNHDIEKPKTAPAAAAVSALVSGYASSDDDT
ncbi:Pre-mRNA-splicing factor [Batrachochytrium dendrobatidis]